jgi:nitrogenase iron protein NifH
LTGGRLIPTVLETYRQHLRKGRDQYAISLEDIVFQGPGGVYCVESGGPEPGIGCAGRGVLTAIQILRDLKACETYGIDVVIYDVLGDVVCGGFSQPIREGYAREIYLVCSGGFMSLYAANNIAKGIQRLAKRGQTGLAGVICNSSGQDGFEKAVTAHFAAELGTKLIHFLPRSPIIQLCEVETKTVLEHSPSSPEAVSFRELAEKVISNGPPVIPKPLEELPELEALYRSHLSEARAAYQP